MTAVLDFVHYGELGVKEVDTVSPSISKVRYFNYTSNLLDFINHLPIGRTDHLPRSVRYNQKREGRRRGSEGRRE